MKGVNIPPLQKGEYKNNDLLQDLIRSHRVLFRARTVFPFEIFPGEVIITENDVHIVTNLFINSSDHTAIPISSINTCSCSTSMVFGSIGIELLGDQKVRHKIEHLWRDDAIFAVRIINGLRVCLRKNIDLSIYDTEYIRKQVALLGEY